MKKNCGFTLIEILVALTILASAVAVLFQLFATNLRTLSASEGSGTAALGATAVMRQVVDQPLVEKSWSETTENGCRADITVAEVQKDKTESLNMKLMEVVIDFHWMQGATPRVLRLVTLKQTSKDEKRNRNERIIGR
jgi:prepilin-type N-terminal cleavage/methylation domain-containing protein